MRRHARLFDAAAALHAALQDPADPLRGGEVETHARGALEALRGRADAVTAGLSVRAAARALGVASSAYQRARGPGGWLGE
jgi:hypothetical protein